MPISLHEPARIVNYVQDPSAPYTGSVSKVAVPAPPDLDEYSYSNDSPFLSEREATEAYVRAKREDPSALVYLDQLDCCHWSVQVYRTDEDKNEFLMRYYQKLLKRSILALLGT